MLKLETGLVKTKRQLIDEGEEYSSEEEEVEEKEFDIHEYLEKQKNVKALKYAPSRVSFLSRVLL